MDKITQIEKLKVWTEFNCRGYSQAFVDIGMNVRVSEKRRIGG
jgi:hypothetical protein